VSGPAVVECQSPKDLPKGWHWMYIALTREAALAMHEAKKRKMPEQVFHLRNEWYFPSERPV
jgi:hypothetical protein